MDWICIYIYVYIYKLAIEEPQCFLCLFMISQLYVCVYVYIITIIVCAKKINAYKPIIQLSLCICVF